MSEISDLVSDQPSPVVRRATDLKAVALRAVILVAVLAGGVETIMGLHDAWDQGVPADPPFGQSMQHAWALLPFVLLVVLAALRVSKRSLATVLVTALLCWFMSTGYFNFEEMGIGVLAIPLIQLVFIVGAIIVMFTFWLLRTRPSR